MRFVNEFIRFPIVFSTSSERFKGKLIQFYCYLVLLLETLKAIRYADLLLTWGRFVTVDAGEDGGESEGAPDVRAHADDRGSRAQQRPLPQFYITIRRTENQSGSLAQVLIIHTILAFILTIWKLIVCKYGMIVSN